MGVRFPFGSRAGKWDCAKMEREQCGGNGGLRGLSTSVRNFFYYWWSKTWLREITRRISNCRNRRQDFRDAALDTPVSRRIRHPRLGKAALSQNTAVTPTAGPAFGIGIVTADRKRKIHAQIMGEADDLRF